MGPSPTRPSLTLLTTVDSPSHRVVTTTFSQHLRTLQIREFEHLYSAICISYYLLISFFLLFIYLNWFGCDIAPQWGYSPPLFCARFFVVAQSKLPPTRARASACLELGGAWLRERWTDSHSLGASTHIQVYALTPHRRERYHPRQLFWRTPLTAERISWWFWGSIVWAECRGSKRSSAVGPVNRNFRRDWTSLESSWGDCRGTARPKSRSRASAWRASGSEPSPKTSPVSNRCRRRYCR